MPHAALLLLFGLVVWLSPKARPKSCEISPFHDRAVFLADGSRFYVEPTAVSESRSKIFLAGVPNYVFPARSHNGATLRNTLFGVIIDSEGLASPIPYPLAAGRVSDIRVVVLADGTWASTFAETDSSAGSGRDPTVAYWFGITNGDQWITLERLPTVLGSLDPSRASALVRAGYALSIALPLTHDERVDIALYTLRNGSWQVRVVPTGPISYVALASRASGMLDAFLVYPDPAEASDANSLFWYVIDLDDSLITYKRLARGGDEPIHEPVVAALGQTYVVAWNANMVAQRRSVTRYRILGPETGTTDTELGVNSFQVIPVTAGLNTLIWLTLVLGEPSPGGTITFTQYETAGPVQVASRANPFLGLFGAFASDARTLIMIGPKLDKGRPYSHLIKADLNCRNTDTSMAVPRSATSRR